MFITNLRIKDSKKSFENSLIRDECVGAEGSVLETSLVSTLWALRDSNPRPSACKADALNQLS